jgi:succinate dehydrogenase / fumarate reductase, iron-sulfur subunit
MDVQLRIRRYNPEADHEPHWEEYRVEAEPTDRVLDLLHQVKWYQDGINGRNRLACEYLVKDAGSEISVEAIRGLPVVKDLLVDMEPFWESYKSVKPFLVNDELPADGKERRQSPADRARYEDTSRCILCAACTTSCPIFWSDQSYVGPASIVNAHRFIVDSRDQAREERLEIMADPDGVWRCRTTFNCVEACPRDIKITKAILEVTNEIGKAGIG